MRRWMTHATVMGLALLILVPLASAEDYRFRVVAAGLSRPLGLTVEGSETIYFSQVPTQGVPGGANSVVKFDLDTGQFTVLHQGEPEPTNLALDRNGNLYWTCKSAGVILVQSEDGVTRVFPRSVTSPAQELVKSGQRSEVGEHKVMRQRQQTNAHTDCIKGPATQGRQIATDLTRQSDGIEE